MSSAVTSFWKSTKRFAPGSTGRSQSGLSGVVSDDQLHGYVREQTDMQACADGLVQLALDTGSRDNVSCVIMEVVEK